MKVLVTGASGLLGNNVIRELLDRKLEVRALIRPESNISGIASLPIEIVFGCITSYDDINYAVKSCNIIIHCAALTSAKYHTLRSYLSPNVNCIKLLTKAAEMHQVKKLIFVSSAATIEYGSKQSPGSEHEPAKGVFSRLPYVKSKLLAEKRLLEAAKKSSFEAVIVNPTFMIGPYDQKPSSGQLIVANYGKRFHFMPPGGKNFVYVKDVAIAICNAIERGRHGERYLLANENLNFKEFYKLLERESGRVTNKVIIPSLILKLVGFIGSMLGYLGINTIASHANAGCVCVEQFYSNEKAINDLDMPATPIQIALKDSINWFKQNDYIPKTIKPL